MLNLFKSLIAIIPAVFLFLTSTAQHTININFDKNDTLIRPLAVALGDYLKKASGESVSFSDQSVNSEGINLTLRPGFQTSLQKEGFALKGDGRHFNITANHINGLRNGMYYYLGLLGFRFYLPGAAWTHIPSIATPFLKTDKQVYPLFADRAMFPTGGFRKNLAVDPNDDFGRDWSQWLTANLYSSEEKIDGHIGEAFNTKHKKELLADTTLLALVNGQRKWSSTSKWCISNAKFVDMFVQDRVDAYAVMKQRFPDRNLISVEPADGYGDCECDNCKKMGTISDRDFYLASKAAEAIEKKWPGGGVSLYAYNTHAAVPSVAPRANVFVLVIPYRYQNVTEPAVLLSKWKEKSDNLGIYDYWGTSDGCLDLPLFNYIKQLPQKYSLWHDLKLKGFNMETGYSKFNNALAYYFFSRMIWFNETDLNAMLQDFCDVNFKKASPLMFNMLQRWGINFKTRFEISTSLAELQKAYALETDPMVQRRLNEVKAVLTYGALEDNAMSNLAQTDAIDRVEMMYKYIWSVHDMRIINTGDIQGLVRQKLNGTKKDVDNRWTLQDALKNKPFWDEVVKFKVPDPLPESMTNPYAVSLGTNTSYPVTDEKSVDALFTSRKEFAGNDVIKFSAQYQFKGSVITDANGELSLAVTLVEAAKNSERIPVVAVYDEDGFFVSYKDIGPQQTKQTIQFQGLQKSKRYIVAVFATSNFEVDCTNRLFLLDGTDAGTVNVKLLSDQQPALMLPASYKYYFDPYKFNGQLSNEQNKTVMSKSKAVAKRSALAESTPDTHFLQITTNKTNPFVLEVINGKTLYGFLNRNSTN